MKKIYILLGSLFFITMALAQQPANTGTWYYFGKQKIILEPSKQKIYLRLPAAELNAAKVFLKSNFPVTEKNMYPLSQERFLLIDLQQQNETLSKNILAVLKNSGKAELVRPALIAPDGKDVVIDEGFYVKLKPAVSYQQLLYFAESKNCIVEKRYPYNNNTYLLKAGAGNQYDGLKMANQFYESGLFEYAEPDFQLLEGTTAIPNDPLFNLQWAAINTGAANQFNGTPGADIDLDEAWDITMGNAAIKIAVLDEGVQRTHPDLINNISPLGFGLVAANATTGNVLANTRTHGTSCAGIIAAEANNNIGISGVAPLSKIIPVNITTNTTGTFGSSAQIAQAIDWSWNEGGADVLSNSWGGGTASSLVHDAIIRATTLGRGGKGSIVVFASGNNNAGVSSPAFFKEAIAVGAMSMCYQRKSGTSCDNETFWGGNYGTALDISAPGVKIATTRNVGTGTAPNADYNPIFNGTSSATPFVSGVVALILSINSNFTQQQVRDIVERSARKVGPYSYGFVPEQPNGSWTSELGYGMVNAKNAVLLAQNPAICNVVVTQPASLQVCSGGNVSLQIANHTSGNTYQWRRDASIVGSGTGFSANQSGNYDVILTTSTGCKDTSYAMAVLVSAAQGTLIADAGRDTTLCMNARTFLGGGPAGSGGTGIIHPMRALATDYSNNQLVRFDLQQPTANFNIIRTNLIPGQVTDEFYSGSAVTPYGIYMVNRLSRMLVKLDTATGAIYPIGLTGSVTFNAVAYDPVSDKIFAIGYVSSNSLYEINRLTGVATLVAPITGAAGTNALISLSIDNIGQLFALRLSATLNVSAQMLSINKTTGVSTLIGNTGFLASFSQGGDADPLTGELYQVASTSILGSNTTFVGKGLWKINKTTGFATLVGSVAEPYNQLDALAIANKEYKYQWSPATNLSNANDANPEFTATGTGSFTYTLTVTDLCGNISTDQVTIVVNALPAAPVISPANPVLSHRNAFAETLTYTQQSGLNYVWVENGTEQSNTTNNFPLTFSNSPLSQYAVKATNPVTGCSSTSNPVSFTYATGVLQNSNAALTVCDSSFYDAGGPTGLTGNNFTRTFTPATPGTMLKLTFYNFNMAQFATLFVYDGPTASSPRIEALDQTFNGTTVRSYTASNPDGILTVRFSIGSFQGDGWLAGLTCEQPLQFRSIANGNWNNAAIWENKTIASSTWTAATRSPNKGDDTIEVRHTVNVSEELPADDIIVTGRLQVTAAGNLRLYKVKPASELVVQTGGNFDVLNGRFVSGGTIELKGNLENSGSISTDEIIVNGTTAQQLNNSSGAATDIKKLVMNNVAGLTVQGMHNIENIELNNGLIQTSADNTIRYDNASGGSANSYINGVVRMRGNSGMTNKLIPVGKGGAYRPLLLSASTSDGEGSAILQAEVMPGAPTARSFPAGITNVSAVRYYKVDMIDNPVNIRDFNITLPYGLDDGVADHTILRVAKDNGAGAWINLGGTATGAAPGTIESQQFSSFSDFVLANVVAGPVPVTLLSFSGRWQQNSVVLNWSVENEINFSRYEIERSINTTNFNNMGAVNANGSSTAISYQFTDDNVATSNIFYYRLKMIDLDGSYRYSNQVVLRKDAITESRIVSVNPNPFVQTLTIQYEAASTEKINAGIYNSKGQLVQQMNFSTTEGINQFYIDGTKLSAGIYMLRLQTDKQLITQKIVKQ